MKHGSLFSGIGGFDLAAKWMNWENVFHCEINPFCQQVLKYHFSNSISYENIKETDFRQHKNKIDIISGGFPCQPFSLAGKRLGKKDERHLWPEMLRVIREIQPKWVLGENVFGIVNWNGGLVFEEVQADLETEGYEVQPYVLPAASVNAPHKRERVWFVARKNVADTDSLRLEYPEKARNIRKSQRETQKKRGKFTKSIETNGINGNAADTDSRNSETWTQREVLGQSNRKKANGYSHVECTNQWQNFPTKSPVCSRNDGVFNRLDGITFSKWRNETIKAAGNAIVPQVAYQIFKAIEIYDLIYI